MPNIKIKVTIEIPDEESITIETNQLLALASVEDNGENAVHRVHVISNSTYSDTVCIGYEAVNTILEMFEDKPKIRDEFMRAIVNLFEKILTENSDVPSEYAKEFHKQVKKI